MSQEELYEQAITSVNDLIQYCDDVKTNEIVSCKKHKQACARFIRDINRQGKKDFPYIFDEEKANKFLKWMTFFKHTKGPLAGQNKIPDPIEKFIFGNVYGWVHATSGNRRFRKAYWQVARKNAKSQDLAIVGLYEMSAFGEPYAEVYVAATKKDQTRYVWGEADIISKACEFLTGKIKTKFYQPLSTTVILHEKSGSFFARMSKDDKKKGDGSNPQAGLLDEYHAHETSEFYDVLTSGMKVRKQPILFIITTAGFELNFPCYREEYRYISEILDPNLPIENDRYFVMVNELDKDDEGNLIDDINDEKVWEKANPLVIKTEEGLESIRDELKNATDKAEKMRDFLTKTMNVWVNQRSNGYMSMEKWSRCGVSKKNPMPDLKGLSVTVGFDLSATIDLTSTSFEVPLPDGRIAVFSHSFIPEATLFKKIKTDRMPYDIWAKNSKWITVTPGEEVDYRFMIKYVTEFINSLGLIEKEFCFDRYMATLLMHELTDEGHLVIEIPQGIPTLGVPTKDFRAKVYNEKVIHDNNPVLTMALGNAVTRPDPNDNIMLDKSKSTYRIDPAAALMNAHVRVMVNEPKKKPSIYTTRGATTLGAQQQKKEE